MAGTLRLSVAATRIIAAATNIATEMGSGTTAAEVQALGALLDVLALRPDLTVQAMKLNASGTDDLIPT